MIYSSFFRYPLVSLLTGLWVCSCAAAGESIQDENEGSTLMDSSEEMAQAESPADTRVSSAPESEVESVEVSVPLEEGSGSLSPEVPTVVTDGVVTCAQADLFCEDFEEVAIDNVPSGDSWKGLDSSCSSQTFFTGVSALPAPRLGSNRALNARDHAYAQCRLTTKVPESDDFWIRSYIFWDESVDFTNKETLSIEMLTEEGVGKDDPSLRFGVRSKEPCTANAGPQITMIGLGGGEVTGCDGKVAMPKGQWVCFEAHVQQSGNLLVETFIDGQSLSYESVGKPAVDRLNLGNAPVSKIDHLRLGYFTHNSSGKGDVWIDEVAMATTRLGCLQQ